MTVKAAPVLAPGSCEGTVSLLALSLAALLGVGGFSITPKSRRRGLLGLTEEHLRFLLF